jgi:hypothetical protein
VYPIAPRLWLLRSTVGRFREMSCYRIPSLRLSAAVLCLCCVVASCGSEPAPAPQAPEDGRRLSDAEVERLRALGYVDVVEDDDDTLPDGVLRHDGSRVQPGLTLFSNVYGCSAQLMTLEGEVLKRWSHEPCFKWEHAVLFENGDLLAMHRDPGDGTRSGDAASRAILRFDWEGGILWRSRLPAHHDVDRRPDGLLVTLSSEHRVIPEIDPKVPTKDHLVVLLDAGGNFIEQYSMVRLLESAPERFRLARVAVQIKFGQPEIDLLHSNSIEWMRDERLAAEHPFYALSNFLLSVRHQDCVAIIDWDRKQLVWAWGRGELSGPHDASLLPSGNVLIFDNGLSRGWSRVIEVDPRSDEIVWEYRAPKPEDFYTRAQGAAQRLPNGNTLITDSNSALLFEVTPEGEIVWEYRNTNRSEKGKRSVIARARRIRGDAAAVRFEASD